jgi:hypothetical protein
VKHDWKGGIRWADRIGETRQIPASKTAKVHTLRNGLKQVPTKGIKKGQSSLAALAVGIGSRQNNRRRNALSDSWREIRKPSNQHHRAKSLLLWK